MLIAHLRSPKKAARQQPHHAGCFAILLFPLPFFSKHVIHSAWGSLLSVYLCVTSSFWEQLDRGVLNGKPAQLLSEQSRRRKGTRWGQEFGRALACGGGNTHPAVGPTSSSLRCLNILCCCGLPGMSPWISITVRLNHCLGGICWAYDTRSGHLSQARELIQERNLTGAASHSKSALGL